jgi:hypothetical protein
MAVGALQEVRIGPSGGAKTGVLDAASVGSGVGVAIGCAALAGLQGDSVTSLTSLRAIPTNDAYASTTEIDCKAAAAAMNMLHMVVALAVFQLARF